MITKLKGFRDYYGQELLELNYCFKVLTDQALNFNFQPVLTPTLEFQTLFSHLLGDKSEVVGNELFAFQDHKSRQIVLKPEATAAVARLVLNAKLINQGEKLKVFYLDRMFRYERPQLGRQREFWQFGIEVYNDDSINQMIEIFQLGSLILTEFKLEFELFINWLGPKIARKKYLTVLKKYYQTHYEALSNESQIRFNNGTFFRILDSKLSSDVKINQTAPKLLEFLPSEELVKFRNLTDKLTELKIRYQVDHQLVRGLEYYDNLVFEFKEASSGKLGAKTTIIGGGSYNSLINELNPKLSTPAIGFAIGVERLLIAANFNFKQSELIAPLDYYLITIDPKYDLIALELANRLRLKHRVELDLSTKKISKKLSAASQSEAKKVLIIDDNYQTQKIIVKDLITTKQTVIEINDLFK